MSSIDLSNSKVLKNFLLGQMREGNGEFTLKEKVLVFRDKAGNEYVCPDEMLKEVEVVNKETEEVVLDTPDATEVTDSGEVKKKKKKKLLV